MPGAGFALQLAVQLAFQEAMTAVAVLFQGDQPVVQGLDLVVERVEIAHKRVGLCLDLAGIGLGVLFGQLGTVRGTQKIDTDGHFVLLIAT